MTDQCTIGDAKVTYVVSAMCNKTYNGTVVIERIGNDFVIFTFWGQKTCDRAIWANSKSQYTEVYGYCAISRGLYNGEMQFRIL